jgi:hypothetical protein
VERSGVIVAIPIPDMIFGKETSAMDRGKVPWDLRHGPW